MGENIFGPQIYKQLIAVALKTPSIPKWSRKCYYVMVCVLFIRAYVREMEEGNMKLYELQTTFLSTEEKEYCPV